MAGTAAELLELAKQYAHIDYDDDEGVLLLMIDATLQEMRETIPCFDDTALTSRQKLLAVITIKDLYDNRDKYGRSYNQMRAAASSMLLSETYEEAAK